MSAPRPVRSGEPITAGIFNALRALVLRHRVTKVGSGLLMSQSDAGIMLALSVAPEQVRWARVRSDHSQDPAGMVAATTLYDVRLLGEGRDLLELKPLNRPVRENDGRRIIPAPKGSLCAVIFPRSKDLAGGEPKELIVFNEVTATRRCTTPGDGGPSPLELRVLALEAALTQGRS